MRRAVSKLSLFLSACLGFFAPNLLFASSSHYALIIDAGSTGSRLHLFQYQGDHVLPQIQEIFTASSKPGLSDFAEKPERAIESLKQPLEALRLELEKKHLDPHSIPLSLYGTAGMRLLAPEIQKEI